MCRVKSAKPLGRGDRPVRFAIKRFALRQSRYRAGAPSAAPAVTLASVGEPAVASLCAERARWRQDCGVFALKETCTDRAAALHPDGADRARLGCENVHAFRPIPRNRAEGLVIDAESCRAPPQGERTSAEGFFVNTAAQMRVYTGQQADSPVMLPTLPRLYP